MAQRISTQGPSTGSVLGASASNSTQTLLTAAVQTWEDTPTSERYIQQALAQSDVDLDVLISAYRYYFYKSNATMALKTAIAVQERIRETEQWPLDWEALRPILLEHLEEPKARIFVSAYAASGLLQARLGRLEVAQAIANHVQQLQAKEFGADVLLNILNPSEDEDEED